MLKKLTLVLGGAASGKSLLAERLVRTDGRRPVYIATAEVHDAEMRAKVDRHIEQRGTGWLTIEEPLALGPHLAARRDDEVVLLDCATFWLTNHLLADHDLPAEADALLAALADCAAAVVVVSNEVGMGIVPDNPLSRRFREAQGRLNRQIAEHADLVVAVMAGLPLALKGTLP